MINWIKGYIDKKIDQRLDNHKDEIKELIKDAKYTINNTIIREIRGHIESLLNLKHHNPSAFEHPLENNYKYPKEIRNIVEMVGEIIHKRFRGELQRLRERNESLQMMERKLKKDVKELARNEIETEQFIDELVERIKRKQL